MFKKSLATALLVCTIPAVANASWFLSTQVKSAGGTLNTSNNGAQVVTDGVITKSYTDLTRQSAAATAFQPGYDLRYLTISDSSVDGTVPVSGSTFNPVDGHTYTVATAFKVKSLAVTASNTGGTVSPSSVGNVYYGYKLTSDLTFSFSPKTGYAITGISNVPVDELVVKSVPGGVNTRATVTFKKGYIFTTAVNLQAVTENNTASINQILPQTVVAGSAVTVTASTTKVSSPVYAWSYVSGPSNTVKYDNVGGKVVTTVTAGPDITLAGATTNQLSFTAPSAPGQYKFQVKVGNLVKLATVNVLTKAADAAGQCQFCHTANKIDDPGIATKWTSSSHSSNGTICTTCHAGSGTGGHPGEVTATGTCSTCHNSPTISGFTSSKHWVNSKEYGPEFAGGAVANEINPNESWNTTEFGGPTTCASKCHFKPSPGGLPGQKSVGGMTWADSQNGVTHSRYGGNGCTACHDPHQPKLAATFQDTCLTCHSGSKHGKIPNAFFASKHWNNHSEYGPEFAGQMNTVVNGGSVKFTGTSTDGVLTPNDGYATTEDGAVVTCAYRCHFRPGMGPQKNVSGLLANGKATTNISYNDTLNGVTYTRPGGDACIACHDSHDLKSSYQTCLVCHSGSKHGKVPVDFFASKHWKSSTESGSEFKNQMVATVEGGNVKLSGTQDGLLEPNDGYTTTENGAVVTCAYRCHFRPGMGPQQNVDSYLANGKAISYVTYSSPYGAGKFSRPGGDACLACHDPHGLEANARSTCYTCHTGGNHGWSVKGFEKSSHFTSPYAIAEGMGGPTGKACTQCHNAHSTEAQFFAYSTVSTYNAPVKGGVACQSCHTPGVTYSIYDANRVGKAPHFQTQPANADGYYPTASYITDNPAYSNSCADCHSHNNTINKGWAQGGHGNVNAIPWSTSKDDDWNRGAAGVNYQQAAQKTDCQRCHTAKGFAQFWDSAFTDITPLGGTSSAPLVCSGCHSNVDKGTVRPLPAGFNTGVKTFVGYSTTAFSTKKSVTAMTFPDYKNSNVCIPCHAGRGTGALIKEVYKTPSATPWLIGTKIYAHFASAAGVVNGSSAYEFTTPQGNTHSLIGTNALYGTGNATQGPCVGCHMTANGTKDVPNMSHSVATIDFAAGKFQTDVCQKCHGAEFSVTDVQTSKGQFNASLSVLRNLLLQRGIDALQDEIKSRPGERQGQDMRGNAASQALIATKALDQVQVAERNTGAAFNWWLFATSSNGTAQGDVAGYVHNPAYARQVIMDSIDWMDDYELNGSAQATIKEMVGQPQPTYPDGSNTDGMVIDQTTADKAAAFATPLSVNHVAPASAAYKVQYLNGQATCVTCHNPQESAEQKEAREAWGESGHGEVKGLAWMPASNHLWTASASTANFATTIPASDCVRCHTADGFKQFATGTTPFTNVNNVGGDGKTNSPLDCQACHTAPLTNDSTRLAVAKVSTFYNVSTVDKVSNKTVKSRIQADFPDVEASNMCISCHAGRVNGSNLTELATKSNDWNLSNTSFQNSHYMAAAGVMYMKSGFVNFTTLSAPTPSSKDGQALVLSSKSYSKTLLPDADSTPGGISGGTTSTHRLIGTLGLAPAEGQADGETPYLGRGTDPAQRPLAQGGPCVNCHLEAFNPSKGDAAAAENPSGLDLYSDDVPAKRPGAGHSLSALDETTIKQICLPCHAHTKGLNLENFVEKKVTPAKAPYQDTLELIKKLLLNKYNIKYDSAAYPYFYDLQKDSTGKTALVDWTRKGVAGIPAAGLSKTDAYRLQGACFNLNLLARDPGAYVHGRTYSQRLQYDTVDFLDDLKMNFSALNTARTVYPEKFYGNNANTGYDVDLVNFPVASDGMLWLSGTHPNNNELTPPDNTSVLRLKLRP
jgi:hypothetical protein